MKVLPQDKANHLSYGSLIASCAAVVAQFAMLGLVQQGALPVSVLQYRNLVAAVAAQGSAALAGVVKERMDKRANDRAIANGELPPHSVEGADIMYTALGGTFVAAPLAALSM